MRATLLPLLCALPLLVGCATGGPTEAGAAPDTSTQEERPMIVTDRTATASAAPDAPAPAPVPVRVYEPAGQAAGTLVWAHGGSFLRGTLDWPEADWVSRGFAAGGLRVVSVDYRLASERVKAPAPAEDVAAALAWAAESFAGPVFVGGASAGGQLAVYAALAQADRAAAGAGAGPSALLLLYPTLHAEQRPDPEIAALVAGLPEGKRFRADRIREMYDFYLGQADRTGLVAGELPRGRLAQLPPTAIVSAEADELRASAAEFTEQLRDARVPVSHETEPGTRHGYANQPEASPAARAAAEATIARFLASAALGLPPR